MRDNPCCPGQAYAVERRVFVTYRPDAETLEVIDEDACAAQDLSDATAICCGCGDPFDPAKLDHD